jgi:predicted Fe-Mo cluster-binding NifX family protein
MKIAVTSQNRKTITSHAGKCRKFWVYEVEDNVACGKNICWNSRFAELS